MKTPAVTIGIDEGLNPAAQTCEMDLNVTYWDTETDKVKVLYWDSRFLGHTACSNILSQFSIATEKLDPAIFIQISMGGPAVNCKFHDSLKKQREKK